MIDVTDSSLFTNVNGEIWHYKLYFMHISSEEISSYGSYRRQREILHFFRNNHKFESMGLVSGDDGDHTFGHRLVPARGKLTHQYP